MLTRRILACLDLREGRVVKGVRFRGLVDAGDPAELAARHAAGGADEIVLLDIAATPRGRATARAAVRRTARALFIPLTVGGGVRSLADAEALFAAGADKVSLNSAALERPALITEIAARFGSQAAVVAIDAKRGQVFAAGGRRATNRRVLSWAREAQERGAGEVLLTSMDADGTRAGFDCEITAAVSGAVRIPVIASGGAGCAGHFTEVFRAGRADAALAAGIFHFGAADVRTLKEELRRDGIPVRLPC